MKNPNNGKIERPTDESAEALAITILSWLSADPSLMSRFLAISGIDAGAIRGMIGEPGFYGGLTGFLMDHEPTLMQFCGDNDVRVEWVQACHQHFTGPGEGAWL
jgi:hypothetical protein